MNFASRGVVGFMLVEARLGIEDEKVGGGRWAVGSGRAGGPNNQPITKSPILESLKQKHETVGFRFFDETETKPASTPARRFAVCLSFVVCCCCLLAFFRVSASWLFEGNISLV